MCPTQPATGARTCCSSSWPPGSPAPVRRVMPCPRSGCVCWTARIVSPAICAMISVSSVARALSVTVTMTTIRAVTDSTAATDVLSTGVVGPSPMASVTAAV